MKVMKVRELYCCTVPSCAVIVLGALRIGYVTYIDMYLSYVVLTVTL